MSIGRLSFSQEQQTAPASQASGQAAAASTVSAQALAALKLTAPQQKAVDELVGAFESKNGSAQPTAAQFQGLITQISTLLTPGQRTQLQALLTPAGSARPAAVVTGGNPALSEFNLLAGNSPSGAGSLQLFDYLDSGAGTAPSSTDPSIAGSLWNFGAAGSRVQNALI